MTETVRNEKRSGAFVILRSYGVFKMREYFLQLAVLSFVGIPELAVLKHTSTNSSASQKKLTNSICIEGIVQQEGAR